MKNRAWDSTNKDLSGMTFSPQERRLRNQVSIKATKAHRTVSPLTSNQKDNTKKVNWKEWNLRESVDFESELENYVPLFQTDCEPNKLFGSQSQDDPPNHLKVGNFQLNTSNDINTQHQGLNKSQKDALCHLKNVLKNSLSPDQPTIDASDSVDQINDEIGALLIRYIIEVGILSFIFRIRTTFKCVKRRFRTLKIKFIG